MQYYNSLGYDPLIYHYSKALTVLPLKNKIFNSSTNNLLLSQAQKDNC